jgi:DNA (cytosine-5)-methyltransferase 1
MAMSQLLVRNVPPSLREWIKSERHRRMMTQNELLLDLLANEMKRTFSSDAPLFDAEPVAMTPNPEETPRLPFTFIDLFAGIGGMHFGMEAAGGTCLFASEWDKYARKTYHAWHGMLPHGDITTIPVSEIPDHDVLTAGFPCQPFSLAGVSKKNSLGRAHGFDDPTQGTLFFNIKEIIAEKRPTAFLLENVKNLLSHDGGRTWDVIHSTLTDLGYWLFVKTIDAAGYVPQHRERVFIVGFNKGIFRDKPSFSFPEDVPCDARQLSEILEPKVDPKYTLTPRLWEYLQEYAARHKAKGNGFGFGIAEPEGITRTLSARYHKDGSEILLKQRGRRPRRLTPREAARLMGFPEDKEIVVSDTQAYRQFGNAVVPLVVKAIAIKMNRVFSEHLLSVNGNRLLVPEYVNLAATG